MLGALGMLLEGLHVRLQPHQGKFQGGGDVGLPAAAVDGDPVRVDPADGGHGAEEVDHGLVIEADQEQLEVRAVRPVRPARLALHEHFADSLGGGLGLFARHGAAVVGQDAPQLRPRLPGLPRHPHPPFLTLPNTLSLPSMISSDNAVCRDVGKGLSPPACIPVPWPDRNPFGP